MVPIEDAPAPEKGKDAEKAEAVEPLMLVSLAASENVDWDALEKKASCHLDYRLEHPSDGFAIPRPGISRSILRSL